MKEIRNPDHIQVTTRMMVAHARFFFGVQMAEKIQQEKNPESQNKLMAPFHSQACFFWYYIVLICRCLCKGDHLLTPCDAQLLGLVDEVLGGGHVQSIREWRKSQSK